MSCVHSGTNNLPGVVMTFVHYRRKVMQRSSTRFVMSSIMAVLLMLFATQAAMASNTGDISGTVIDQNGAAVSGANVTIKNVSTGTVRTVPTNEFGQFSAPQMETGNYQIVVDKNGFKQYTQAVVVRSGENTRLDAQLSVGTTSETVTVEGATPTLDVATAQVSESLNSA